MRIFSRVIFLLLVISSCNVSSTNESSSSVKKDSLVDRVMIHINHKTSLWFGLHNDSILVDKEAGETFDSIRELWNTHWETVKKLKSHAICDSIYRMADYIVKHPLFSNTPGHITDYAGNYFTITIGTDESEASFSYNDVYDWRKESPETMHLYNFLKENHLLDNTEALK